MDCPSQVSPVAVWSCVAVAVLRTEWESGLRKQCKEALNVHVSDIARAFLELKCGITAAKQISNIAGNHGPSWTLPKG